MNHINFLERGHPRYGLILAVLDHLVPKTNGPLRRNALCEFDKHRVTSEIVRHRHHVDGA